MKYDVMRETIKRYIIQQEDLLTASQTVLGAIYSIVLDEKFRREKKGKKGGDQK